MITLVILFQSVLSQTQHNTWHGKPSSVSSIVPRLSTACIWQINVQWKCLHSILLAELLPTEDWEKILADLCLVFEASCTSTWNKMSKLTNVITTWTTLELQPIILRTLPGTGSLQVHSPSKIETHNRQVPFRSQTSWIPWQNHFIRRSITTNSQNSKTSLKNWGSRIQKGSAALPGFCETLRKIPNSLPKMAQKLNPFYKLLLAQVPINIAWGRKDMFDSVDRALSDACELPLKQRVPWN